MEVDKIKDKIKIARESVHGEEEPYKTEAFKIVFSKLLESDDTIQTSSNKKNPTLKPSKTVVKTQSASDDVDEEILELINIDDLHFINSLKSVNDKCLAILNYVSENVTTSCGVTTYELKQILAEKFGLTTITIYNISMSLKQSTGKYVTRTKVVDNKTEKYRYQILQAGKDYIKNKISPLIKSKKQS